MQIKVMQVGQLGTNCYLLEDEETRTAAVVDPGGEGARILAQLKADGLELKLILLTHAHFDHTGGVAELCAALPGVPDVYKRQCRASAPSSTPGKRAERIWPPGWGSSTGWWRPSGPRALRRGLSTPPGPTPCSCLLYTSRSATWGSNCRMWGIEAPAF